MNKLASIFIAICLSLGLYHELRICGFPRLEDGNGYNWFMFTKDYRPDYRTPANWESRSFACHISSMWFALWNKPSIAVKMPADDENRGVVWNVEEQNRVCAMIASYHALFFLMTCGLLIIFLDNPIIPMLGTFASILGCSPAFFSPYLMPWDLPTMMVWTFIALLYMRKPSTLYQWLFLCALIVVGGLLKETVLVTALFLLGAPWKLWQRIVAVAAIVVASQLLNWLICGAPPDWMFSIKGINVSGQPHWNPLYLWPVLLTNGGSLSLMPWLLWKRKDLPLALACGAFICLNAAGFMNTGYFDELRDWLELAPLGWVLISSYTKGRISISGPVEMSLQPIRAQKETPPEKINQG